MLHGTKNRDIKNDYVLEKKNRKSYYSQKNANYLKKTQVRLWEQYFSCLSNSPRSVRRVLDRRRGAFSRHGCQLRLLTSRFRSFLDNLDLETCYLD